MGRPALIGRDRYPSGKLKPETAAPAMVRRIIDQARRGAADPRLGSELGRLRLTDAINDRQFAAADFFAKAVGLHDRLKWLPRRTVSSPSYEHGYGIHNEADAEDNLIIAELMANGGNLKALGRKSRRVRAVLRAAAKLDAARGCLTPEQERAVYAVAIYDNTISPADHHHLRSGLAALAEHFHLPNGKSARP